MYKHTCKFVYRHTYIGIETLRHTEDRQTSGPTDRYCTYCRGRQLDSRQTGGKADRLADRKTDVQKE